MKIKEIFFETLYDKVRLTISFEKADLKAVQRLLFGLGTVNPTKEYDVSIKPKKKKRSLDANAYFWKLLGELAEKLNEDVSTLYTEYIHECGVFEIIPIRADVIETFKEKWRAGRSASGWVCEDLGECKRTPNYHNIKCYYGSSTYDSKQMSRLIDAVVRDCKEQGIETMTPNELAELKSKWR